MKIDFVKNNRLFLIISLVLVILAVAAIRIWGLNLGIDFAGGSITEYEITSKPVQSEVLERITKTDVKVSKVVVSENLYTIYSESLDDVKRDTLNKTITDSYKGAIKKSTETISSSVGVEQSKNAITSIILASIGIILFLTYSFNSVPKPFKSLEFGVSAVLALVHDAVIVLGAFAILGHYFGAEIDLLFITAILTVIGFSVHDTIVVFDRIRENTQNYGSKDYKSIVNRSLVETLTRSINLTVATILVLISLFFLGPDSLRWFIGALHPRLPVEWSPGRRWDLGFLGWEL
jgi:preprotein translocase subunit SecF